MRIPELVDKLHVQMDEAEQKLEGLIKQPIEDVVDVLLVVREYDELVKTAQKRLTTIHQKLRTETVPDKFEEAGISSVTVNGFRFTRSETVRASMLPDKKEDCVLWLNENGLSDLVTQTVSSSTLSATARTLMEEGKELPDESFRVYIQPNTSVTKAK